MVTTLRAAEMFEQSHLSSATVAPLIDGAQIFYIEGYMLTHNVACAIELGEKAALSSKVSSENHALGIGITSVATIDTGLQSLCPAYPRIAFRRIAAGHPIL